MDGRAVESLRGYFIHRRRRLQGWTEVEAIDADVGGLQRLERRRITAVGITEGALTIVKTA
jgi:hypothetical protein